MINYLILLFCLMTSFVSAATPMVRVEGASFRPMKIAVPEFNWQASKMQSESKNIASELNKSIRVYLEFSGVFQVLNSASFLVDPKKETLDVNSIQMKKWIDVGAEGLVKGIVNSDGDNISVDIGVYQIGTTKQSIQRKYRVSHSEIKKLALKISDDIFHFFTGESGPFMTQIVAAKATSGGKELVIMDFDGQNERPVTQNGNLNLLPTLLPDGKTVLFTSYLKKKTDLFSIGTNGQGLQLISSYPGLNIGSSSTPDGSKIALTLSKDGDSEIYLMDLKSKNLQRLTSSYGIDTSPSFSPDGKQIAFVSARSGNPHIYLMNVDGSNPKRITFQGKYNQIPRFSPRGDYIVFTARDELKKFDIFLLDLKTQKISRITQNQGDNEEATFLPGGRMVVFTSTREGGRDLFVSNLDGTYQKRITKQGKFWTPSAGPLL
ncbi:MAG: DPP IV N-terminal domain-containing protein [bacterium]|nr:DPP IV N-terminal domain-containing protein [bacterium]